jgi:hypothetical protein
MPAMWLPNKIVDDVKDAVQVFYLPYSYCRYWAEHRAPGEPLVFSGWYWAQGAREAGPFKSQSACFRDAWYRAVTHKRPPALHADALKAEQELRERALAKVVQLPVRRKRKAA